MSFVGVVFSTCDSVLLSLYFEMFYVAELDFESVKLLYIFRYEVLKLRYEVL